MINISGEEIVLTITVFGFFACMFAIIIKD